LDTRRRTRTSVSQSELRTALQKRFRIQITPSGVSRCLQRLGIKLGPKERTPPGSLETEAIPCAGFELIVALAWHFGWPQWTAGVIQNAISDARRSKRFASREVVDRTGRNGRGQFTASYNRRRDVRREKFESVETKRASKSLQGMDLVKVNREILARKCLAALTLPFVTTNGQVRHNFR